MKKFKIVLIIFFVLLFLGSLAGAVYFYKQYRDIKNNPNKASIDETNSIVLAISKFMVLPTDETPTLATITDLDKLKDQSFFKNAMNDDKILIYANAKKAFLYRPSTGKLIEFAPLLIGDESQTSDPEVTSFSVTIYNGTDIEGYADQMENKLSDVENLKVVNKTNASKDDYSQSIVIDISGTNSEKANEIAEAIDGVVDTLPEGEETPNTDLLVILGKESE